MMSARCTLQIGRVKSNHKERPSICRVVGDIGYNEYSRNHSFRSLLYRVSDELHSTEASLMSNIFTMVGEVYKVLAYAKVGTKSYS